MQTIFHIPKVGYIIGFRRGGGRVYQDEVLLRFPGIDDYKRAHILLHKIVVWDNGSTKIYGVIERVHGKKGTVIAHFRKPLPGQAISTSVYVIR